MYLSVEFLRKQNVSVLFRHSFEPKDEQREKGCQLEELEGKHRHSQCGRGEQEAQGEAEEEEGEEKENKKERQKRLRDWNVVEKERRRKSEKGKKQTGEEKKCPSTKTPCE